MSTYSTIRNTGFASVLVATLAGLVTNGLAVSQQVVFEREADAAGYAVVLPEIVVTATRLET